MWKRSFDSDPITATTPMPLSLRPSIDAPGSCSRPHSTPPGSRVAEGATIQGRMPVRFGSPSTSAEAQDAIVLAGLHADLLSRVRGRGRHPLLEERELVVGA